MADSPGLAPKESAHADQRNHRSWAIQVAASEYYSFPANHSFTLTLWSVALGFASAWPSVPRQPSSRFHCDEPLTENPPGLALQLVRLASQCRCAAQR
jgi:hypothetical protein